MSEYTTIILEAYCMRKISVSKGKYSWRMEGKDKDGHPKFRKVPNTFYDPRYKTPRKPSYCPGTPSYVCLEKGCRHLAYSDADEEEYLHDNLYWEEL